MLAFSNLYCAFNHDKMAAKRLFPRKIAYRLIRYKKYLVHHCVLQSLQVLSRMKNFIINGAKKGLGDFPVDPHFIPNYNPWEQRFSVLLQT
jgi:cation diffusion facilitator CzcD-associated flavoprotein CzcO